MSATDGIALFLIARLIVTLLFALAAAGKLRRPGELRKAAGALGIPGPLASAAPALLVVAESSVAIALVIPVTAAWGALAAIGLLDLYTSLVAANLMRGRTPPCACFPWLPRQDSPIGRWTIARNAGMAGLALAVLTLAGPHYPQDVWLALGLAGIVIAVLGVWLGSRPLTYEIPSTIVGLPVPDVRLRDPRGRTIRLRNTLTTSPHLVLFWSPDCEFSRELLPDLREASVSSHPQIVISDRPSSELDRLPGAATVLIDRNVRAARAFGIAGTPSAVLLDGDGTFASEIVSGVAEIRGLLRRTPTT